MTYAFDMPTGVTDMSLVVEMTDNGYLLGGLLVDPEGMELSVQPNLDPFGTQTYALQLFRSHPQPARWRFILLQNYYSLGNQTSLPFTARIDFNTAQVTASGLPNDRGVMLSASGPPVVIPVVVTNTGAVTEQYFADARLTTRTTMPLMSLNLCAPTTTLPGGCALFYVPTEVSDVQFVAQSTTPIDMDVFGFSGFNAGITAAPDVYAHPVAPNTVVASLKVPEVPFGPWLAAPSLIGPYGPAGAPAAPFTTSAVALMQPFDSAASADSGDIWADLTLGTNTFNPLVLAPGQSGKINVTITPDPNQVGTTVSGFLYVDTFNFAVSTGDEVVRIPYRYTIVK